jgi:hypothetical protein
MVDVKKKREETEVMIKDVSEQSAVAKEENEAA